MSKSMRCQKVHSHIISETLLCMYHHLNEDSKKNWELVKDWVNSSQVDDIDGLNCSAEVTNRSRQGQGQ